MKFKNVPLISLIMAILMSCQVKKDADLIITNAKIYSVDDQFSIYEAMAITDGWVTALGSTRDILDQYTSGKLIDAGENAIYPGFIDGHCHFYGFGLNLYQYTELKGTRSFGEILDLLKSQSGKPAGKWILGRGWDQNDWPEKTYPDRQALDELFPDNPVMLIRIDGHAVLANGRALDLAGITPETVIPGGQVLLQDGRMTGILIDNAADFLKAAVPEISPEEKKSALQTAEKELFSHGLTCVADAGLEHSTVILMDEMQQAGDLKMRVYAMLSPTQDNLEKFILQGPYATDRLNVRSVKLYADGALGSRGALMLEPYSDSPGHHGLQINSKEYYLKWLKSAFDNGYQVNTHCIGDSANRLMLDLYAEVLGGPNERRWRIEHAQVVHPDDFDLFGNYDIIPSVQSTHCTSDMYWAGERIGPERLKSAYASQQLLSQNGWLVNGTDFPVEEVNPLLTFFAAVARQDQDGYPEGGFQPENALSREDALRSITLWPAMGAFDESRLGSLELGKKADFVILDRDLMEVPIEHVPGANVMSTYLNGELVFER